MPRLEVVFKINDMSVPEMFRISGEIEKLIGKPCDGGTGMGQRDISASFDDYGRFDIVLCKVERYLKENKIDGSAWESD